MAQKWAAKKYRRERSVGNRYKQGKVIQICYLIYFRKLRSRIGKFVLSDQKLFNPSELPFMDLIQKSFGVDAVNEIDKHPICCEE